MKITQQIRSLRRKAAEERKEAYDKLSLQEKLDRLPKDGAKKQRARLMSLLEDTKKPKVEASSDLPKEEKKNYQKPSKQ